MAQPANGTVPAPSAAAAEEGMAEVLANLQLSNCAEDTALMGALFDP